MSTMKKMLKIIVGLAMVAAGVLWILNTLNVVTLDFSLEGWWALFIIIPCLFGLVNDKNKVGPCIGLGWGVLLLLAAREVISWNMMWQIGLALMIIGLGIQMLFFKGCCHKQVCEFKTISRDGKEIRRIESSFGKQQLSFAGEKFQGADVESSFGALILDLKGAILEEDACIDLEASFGAVTIIVPEGLSVKTAITSGFGGVSDNRRIKADGSAPVLYVTGKVGFGGVEIKD